MAETGSKVKAARQARVARSTVGEWERADPAFRKAVVEAKQDSRVQRAQTRYGKDPSQGSMIRLLAAMRPEQYGWAVKRPSRPRPERQPKTDPAALLRSMLQEMSAPDRAILEQGSAVIDVPPPLPEADSPR